MRSESNGACICFSSSPRGYLARRNHTPRWRTGRKISQTKTLLSHLPETPSKNLREQHSVREILDGTMAKKVMQSKLPRRKQSLSASEETFQSTASNRQSS